MINVFNYIERKSPIHSLTGATKLVCVLLWSLSSMVTYDTRLLLALVISSLVLFGISKIKLKEVSFVLGFMCFFLVLNNLTVYLFSPQYGVRIYGTSHELFLIGGNYNITLEQLFYHLNLILKFLSMVPAILLFVSTTNPSEFAASLNRIGVKYSIAYSVALTLRYIPDIQKEYHDISQAQQARGVEMTSKENVFKRIKSAASILVPLILSSMSRIEVVSNAMELRGFGKNKKRTWYMARPFKKMDIIAMVVCGLLFVLSLSLNFLNGSRFWNPFV